EKELERAKILSIKAIVDSLKTIDGKARALATSEITTGNYENILNDFNKYLAVTPEELKSVASKYLNQNQRSVVVLEPKQ
ncbi:MAG: insulinase family protein, partial [Bdellovibrionaceae bacterium]|nr:insulinase family protein [Pseudobdellovibrionaceae bacterium]